MSSSAEERRALVAVCVPTYRDVHVRTTLSLVLATNFLRASNVGMLLLARTGPYTHWNREHLVRDALAAAATHVMFVDADVVFETDSMLRLLRADKAIIGGCYAMKDPRAAVANLRLAGPDGRYIPAMHAELPPGPFPVAALGTGFLLIRLADIADLPRPLFPCDFGDGPEANGDREMVGEDIAFCRAAVAHGIEVWAHGGVQLAHIGDYDYTLAADARDTVTTTKEH